VSDEHTARTADVAQASRPTATLAENARLVERVASIRMATGPDPWPVADGVGKVTWVSDPD